jgi:ADP-heptose:LPS heptosyltransferase
VQDILGDWRDYILLVNAKSDKGFNLLVDTAKAVPHARFLVIASQSDQHEAVATIKAAGIGNIRVIGHTNRMDILYMHARAVAVASYRFVETFSRVCIEAQRYGKPVLGSTVGNVPFLLKTSGVILPENVDSWSSEVSRIYLDGDHYQSLVTAAYENSEKYAYSTQVKAIHGILSTISSGILIGVGSGIGNMLHVAPMIRNIARRLGRKVDLVVTEDHQNSLFLLQNDEYVNAVYSVRQAVLRKKYDMVFVTHSFGNARLPFQAKTILYARDWQNFEPGGEYHETIYNLESAKAVLGVNYDEADIGGYYLGNYKYTPPVGGTVRIGVHGGSKDGFWRSKRWPYHAELAHRLQARGYEVASFGIAEEYVPGTTDMTGGTIAEMVEHMLGLDYFISNDSGLMNIANALGIPVIGLFAPTNPLTRGPIGPNSRWLAIEKDCAPCEVSKIGRQTFHAGSCKCIAEMSLERVETAVLEHIGEGLARRT